MKKILLLMGLMMALISAPTYAQDHGICGTTIAQGQVIKERLLENRRDMENFVHTRGVVTYVPIKIHLVGLDDGSGRMSEAKALDMLCILNEEWEPLDIQFYLKDGFSYVNKTFIANHAGVNTAVWNQANGFRVNNALNVFVTNTVTSPGGGGAGGGTTLAYYTPSLDCIFIRQASVYGKNVLPHEAGHFFSLNHPFLGWEEQPWDEATHGLQVGLFSPDGTPNEKVDDPNCANINVADAICDTPPDYLFGFGQSGCGEFNQGTMDPNGVVIDPMENNTMSYFSGCDQYQFTDEQITAIQVDLGKPNRNYVNPGITPNLDEVNGIPSPTFPIAGEETFYNAAHLQWEAVPGATHYYVELDRFNNFAWMPLRRVVDANELFVGDFCTPNVQYYWRVRAFNEYRTCSGFTSIQTFMTNAIASKVSDVEGINNWMVRPNPATSSDAIFIDMETTKSLEATVNVYSVTGQLLSTANNTFAEGANTLEVATTDLSVGLYMVSIQTEAGVTTKRLVIR